MTSCKLSDGVWACALERPGRGLSYIEWAAEQSVSPKLKGDEFVIVEDLAGSMQKMRAKDLIVTSSPVLVSPI